MNFPLFPPEASHVARQTDFLFWALTALSGLMLLLLVLVIGWFILKYHRGRKIDRSVIHLPETKIEIAWTVIPTLLMMGLFVWGAERYFSMQRVPPNAMEINIVGKQWMWKVQHPGGQREINELHVPVGRVLKLMMTSQDVIHSFFLPAFRIKQDVLPGRYTTQWLQATRPGRFRLYCSEFCGTDHSRMNGWVTVMEPAAYEEWLVRGQPAGATLAQTGEVLYRELGCSGCHSGSSVVRAPPLEGLFNKPVPLQDGTVTVGDEAYLRDSIIFPNKQVTAGYEPVMPSFQGRLTEEEIMQLIAYIKSISGAPPQRASPGMESR
ncbi:MAG TPA: cytochrome c oxidase subunit II [Clostridia bacterium]|nr:cytochrome c oxidase subunit II [Clostridia bacterium]